MKCKFCNKNVKQYMAIAKGNLVKRFHFCKKCKVIFIEYVYSPFVRKSNGEIIELENVIGDVSSLKEHEVFKVLVRKVGKRTYQSTLM